MSQSQDPNAYVRRFGIVAALQDNGASVPAQPNVSFEGDAVAVVNDAVAQTTRVQINATVISKKVDSGSAAVGAGKAVMMKNGLVTLAVTAALALGSTHGGIAISGAAAGGTTTVVTQGLVDPAVVNVGAGTICAVGTKLDGTPVRISDPLCVSGSRILGVCDANGAIFVDVRRAAKLTVWDYGAVGDDTADDTAALNAAFAAGVLEIPPGTFKITGAGLSLTLGGEIHLTGTGTIKAHTASMTMLGAGSSGATKIKIDGPKFDLNLLAGAALNMNGAYFTKIEIDDVDFINCKVADVIEFVEGADVSITNCLFDGNGLGQAGAIAPGANFRKLYVGYCTFRGMNRGVVVAPNTNGYSTEDVTIEHNDFDFMYYASPAIASGGGSTVTYTQPTGPITFDGTMIDTAKTFVVSAFGTPQAISQYGYIRVLPTRASGSGLFGKNIVIDGSAHFTSDNIIPGELVRTATAQAVIVSVESDTALNIEPWTDMTTTALIIPPGAGAYTVLGVILAKISNAPGAAGTTLTLYGNYSNLNGTQVTPANNTPYEIVTTPNYPIQTTGGSRRVRILNNTIKRSYTDAISPFGDDVEIASNTIVDCQDVGITCSAAYNNGGRFNVHDNKIYREGTHGIFLGNNGSNAPVDGTDVHDNLVYGFGARTQGTATATASGNAGVGCEAVTGAIVHHNTFHGAGLPNSFSGVGVDAVTGIVIQDNTCIDLTGHDIAFVDCPSATAAKVRHESIDIIYLGTSVAQFVECLATSSPQGVLSAKKGSRVTDQATGLVWYNVTGTVWSRSLVQVRTITANYVWDASGPDDTLICDTSGGAFQVTLFAKIAGRCGNIIDKANSFATHNLTLVRAGGSGKIDGVSASLVLSTNGTRIGIESDGTDYYSSN